jgi:hypothetical protein
MGIVAASSIPLCPFELCGKVEFSRIVIANIEKEFYV